MDTSVITDRIIKMLELKLSGKVEELNSDNLAYNVCHDILDNLFAMFEYDLKQNNLLATATEDQVRIYCMEGAAKILSKDPQKILIAFKDNIKASQKEEVHKDSIKLGEYFVGALPALLTEMLSGRDFIAQAAK